MVTPFKSTIEPTALFSNYVPCGKLAKIFHFPLTRFIVIAVFLIPVFALNALVVFQLIEQAEEPLATNIDIVRMLLTIPVLLLTYGLYCRLFEKRKALEISLPGAGKEWGGGLLVAAVLVVLLVALISVFGSFEITEYRPAKLLLTNFLVFSMGSLLQDLILLCVVFRLVEEFAGTWIALVTSMLLFGVVHLGNANQTLGSVIMLVFSSLILIAPFILTRRLWLSWGFHAGWNFMQAGVFGMANSGLTFPGWMVSSIEGPDWLTGGAVGLEGSYVSFGIDLAIGMLLLFAAIKAGNMVRPGWKRIHS